MCVAKIFQNHPFAKISVAEIFQNNLFFSRVDVKKCPTKAYFGKTGGSNGRLG